MKFWTNGLIIREQNIGEQDKLVTVLTESNGVIKAFVKGAKNIKNQKCASTQLLCYSRMTINRLRNSYIISDAKSIEMFIKLRSNVVDMCLAQYFCEFAGVVCPIEQNAKDFLQIILNGLYLLANKKQEPLIIKPCIEMRLMCLSGYMPDLTMCKECGSYEKDLMYFLPQSGNLLCRDCAQTYNINEKGICMNFGTVTALRHTIYADPKKLFYFTLDDKDTEILNMGTDAYVKLMLEKDFKTLEFFKTISRQT